MSGPTHNQPLPLSVAIITLNEAANLPRCLESVSNLATEIVVLDSGSTDKTGEIARAGGAKFEFHTWEGYVGQKNLAMRRCSQPWVLCMDADEALTTELAASIRNVFAGGGPGADGFYVNRRTFYLGRWIRHAWYPEWRLRFVRRERAQWRGGDVHEALEVTGATERLSGDLLHYSFRDLEDHLERTIRYARLAAAGYAREGRQFRWHDLLLRPGFDFVKRLVFKQGWRDGWRGWIISFVTMFGTFAKYAFLLEEKLTRHEGEGERRG